MDGKQSAKEERKLQVVSQICGTIASHKGLAHHTFGRATGAILYPKQKLVEALPRMPHRVQMSFSYHKAV